MKGSRRARAPAAKFWNPTRVLFGPGALDELGRVLPNGPVAVVTSPGSTTRGLTGRILGLVDDRPCAVVDDVNPNPEPADLLRQLDALPPDVAVVIAAGGGSAMDSGKVLAVLTKGRRRGLGSKELQALALGGTVDEGRSLPVVAVPTTAGTGSETTPFATIWDRDQGVKRSMTGPGLFPHIALVDPELTLGIPESITVSAGLDALSQGLEAWWNRNAGPVTDALSLRAVKMTLDTLRTVVDTPDDLDGRSRMMEASLLAGMAISGTRTAVAHSISYPLTLRFGIPHGLACAFALPTILTFNADGPGTDRMAKLASGLGHPSVVGLAAHIRDLLRSLDVRARMCEYQFDPGSLPSLGPEMIHPGRSENNLREVSSRTAVDISLQALEDLR